MYIGGGGNGWRGRDIAIFHAGETFAREGKGSAGGLKKM